MKRQYKTHCWFCNSTKLEPDDRGIRCRSCGATYNLVTKPSSAFITERRDYALAPKGRGSAKSPSPSSRVLREATKIHRTTG